MGQIGFLPSIKNAKKTTISNILAPSFTHACIIGETGSGKTTSMINPNLQHRLELGHGVLVFDHKGNYHTTVKALAKRAGRLEDVIVIGMPWDKKCSIFEDMDESSLIDFLTSALQHGTDDKFWEQSAVNLAIPIIRVVAALQKLNSFEVYQPLVKSFADKYTKSIKTLHAITTNRDSLKKFSEELEALITHDFIDKEISKILRVLVAKIDKEEDKEAKEILKAYMHFEKVYTSFQKETIHSNAMKDKQNRTFDNIMISLNGPIGAIANIDYINVDEVNINDALNHGKIIVFLCNQLPEVALASITKSLFQNFNERIGHKAYKDVTIFIDEAQRVLNKDIDLPIDTLREARVDVFMAFQSKALLYQKLGLIKTEALDVNLTSRYYFKNKNNDDEMETAQLEAFSFLTNLDKGEKNHKATTIFIKEKELFDTEYAYQKMINATQKYKEYLPSKRRPYILRFIPSSYAKERLSICYKNGEIQEFSISKEFSLKTYKLLKEKIALTEEPEVDEEDEGITIIDMDDYDLSSLTKSLKEKLS